MKPASNNTSPDSPNANDDYRQALTHLDCEKYEEAIVYLNNAIEMNPNFAEAYNQRCFAYWKVEAYQWALADGNKAIEINPPPISGKRSRLIPRIIFITNFGVFFMRDVLKMKKQKQIFRKRMICKINKFTLKISPV